MRVPAARHPVRRLRPVLIAVSVSVVATSVVVAILFRELSAPPADDLAIVNAIVYDGTGGAPFRGGITVRDGRIADVWQGRRWRVSARKVIDAHGFALAPGFVDTHTHADLSIGESSSPIRADNFAYQGVTTLITGNCGRSPVDFARFRQIVESRGANVNIAALAGLNTIRESVMHESAAAPTSSELDAMRTHLERQFDEGAIGVSTGLEYVPGRFATREETLQLLKVAARHHAVHASHIRNEGRFVVDSAREILSLSAEADIPLLISHLKVAGPRNCAQVNPLLSLLERYRSKRPLFVDQYPYAASSTSLEIYLPDWFLREDGIGRRRILRDRRGELKADITARLAQDGFEDFRFARVVKFPSRPQWSGLTIRAIDYLIHGQSTLESQLDVVLDLADRGGVQMVYHNLCPEVVTRIQRTLSPMIGSDSAIREHASNSAPHPRGWGAFAKFLGHSVRQRRVASLQEGIRRMTDLPARFFGLTGRGRIAPRYFADLVIFDPASIAARASYRYPFREPVGIEYVFVNGTAVVTLSDSQRMRATGAFPGVFIVRNDRLHRRPDGTVVSTLPDTVPGTAVRAASISKRGHAAAPDEVSRR